MNISPGLICCILLLTILSVYHTSHILYITILGYGVFVTKYFEKSQFLLEYPGELISEAEGSKREKKYKTSLGSFIFYYEKYWYVSLVCILICILHSLDRAQNNDRYHVGHDDWPHFILAGH